MLFVVFAFVLWKIFFFSPLPLPLPLPPTLPLYVSQHCMNITIYI